MGNFFNKVLTGFDAVARGLNEAAFGDIRNVFNGSVFDNFLGRPIGLVANSYEYMISHLRRNIGNSIHVYDGFSTPIGELANPFYNSFFNVPWFFMDGHKNSTANYIDYVKATYGASTSVENINENFILRIVGAGSSVGTTAIRDILVTGATENISLINPNGLYSDTKLGIDSTNIIAKMLGNAISYNDMRDRNVEGNLKDKYMYGITNSLKDYFGLKTITIQNNILDVSSHNFGESFLSNGYYSSNDKSPVYNSNYGFIDSLGIYDDYVENLSEDALYHFKYNSQINLNGNVTSRITASDAGTHDGGVGLQYGRRYLPTKEDNYFARIGITPVSETIGFQSQFYHNSTNEDSIKLENSQIRYIFKNAETTLSNVFQGGVFVYTELDEDGKSTDIQSNSFNSGTRFSTYTSFGEGSTNNGLLKKTNLAFKQGKYNTIIAKFKTGAKDTDGNLLDLNDALQTAVSKEYGMSHGRNLLKIKENQNDESQGYNNPYCRVWTFHHQYHRLADSIRPFQEKGEKGNVVISQSNLYSKYGFSAFSADHSNKEGFEDGRTRLGKYGVMNQHNGLVNITPIDNRDPNKKVDIKNCMFSIENLAWKGMWGTLPDDKNTFQNGGLSSEQKGPFGGRIMWFPPYALKFNETVNVDWNENNFIGRGESIYTYRNTKRSGQLSFKLLIDHPSIINYWKNRGQSRSNSVDDVNDPEQQLLRFFAGCEMLSSKKAETKKVETATEDIPQPSPNIERYTFFVFFPNDYSGVNDDPKDVVEYLTNGIGTWKNKDGNDCKVAYSNCIVDGKQYGGYEVRLGKGISYVTAKTTSDKILTAKYGVQPDVDIYTQKGNSGKWYYRIDNKRSKEKYKSESNYIDSQSFGLNSVGVEQALQLLKIDDLDKLFSFTDVFVALTDSENNSNEVLKNLYNEESVNKLKNIFKNKNRIKEIICTGQASIQGNSATKTENEQRNKELAKQRANTIQNWLRNKLNGVNITSDTISPKGEKYPDDINSLVNKAHRCVKVEIDVETEMSATAQDELKHAIRPNMNGDILSEMNTGSPNYPSGTNMIGPIIVDDGANIFYDEKTLKRKENYMKLSSFGKSVDYLTFNIRNSYENGNINLNGVYSAAKNFININKSASDISLNYPGDNRINIGDGDVQEDTSKGDKKVKNFVGKANSVASEDERYETREQELVPIKRYDNESKFFEMLEIEEPFMHQKISDKIKYFDPAFHSISPEGFNARLTFLQQCARQGPTCGSSDVYTGDNTANNLSFGRPPVCILRIGDFYYTKIIIESITIDFGDVMWDLNAEGIGVMPMIADINITFNYIGGSSLSGPISRLQNALSFNAYANTEVYDNRAELPEYNENGDLVKFGHNPLK